jgi:hypothetical protein
MEYNRLLTRDTATAEMAGFDHSGCPACFCALVPDALMTILEMNPGGF